MDPGGDWLPYLAERDVPVLTDAVGRDSVLSSDARALLAEFLEAAATQREAAARHRERLEHEAEEQDRVRRSQIWKGVPASSFPDGVSAASVMVQAIRDSQPKRQSVLQEALSPRDGVT